MIIFAWKAQKRFAFTDYSFTLEISTKPLTMA